MRKNKESGQALIELIIFLPLMFTIYGVISGFANAINGSINQQKISRAYFYYKLQNNSTIPKPDTPVPGQAGSWEAWGSFGMFFIGWKNSLLNDKIPIAPCYKMTIPLSAAAGDPPCGNPYTNPTTQWIRVSTIYGICGATYVNLGNSVYPQPDHSSGSYQSVIDKMSCLITPK